MARDTTKNGKAFEYACLEALRVEFSRSQRVCVLDSEQLHTAERCYLSLKSSVRSEMCKAASAMKRVLVRLEPKLRNCRDGDVLSLSLQSDERGQSGDVRDVLCMRVSDKWEIGLSCKHNHSAVKHSRLAKDLDFGKKWAGCPCSSQYFAAVNPIFERLGRIRASARASGRVAIWRDMADKDMKVYLPVLDAFIEELKRIDRKLGGGLAPRLVHYLLGEKDFYKVIADDGSRSTRIEAYNLSGTLGEPSLGIKSLYGRQKLKLPTRIIEIRHKDGSNNTVELTCDRGWQFSLRIHNASSEVEPSLKFDIQLVSKLSSHASVNLDEPWREIDEEMSNMILDDVAESLRFRKYLPLYSLRAACGVLGAGEAVEPEGWVKAEGIGKFDNTMVVVQAKGNSMEPMIHDGDLCVVRALGAADYNNRIVLVQRNDQMSDPDGGGAYLLKKYIKSGEGAILRSLNPANRDIEIKNEPDVTPVAYLHKVLSG